MKVWRHTVTSWYEQVILSRDVSNMIIKNPSTSSWTVFYATKPEPSVDEEFPIESWDRINLNFDAATPTQIRVKWNVWDYLHILYS